MSDGSGGRRFQVLSWDRCVRLLRTRHVGRIGLATGGFPLILPVNYRIDQNGVIVMRTAAGTAIDAADHANVAFEVDEIDETDETGWSVLVHALAERVTEEYDAEQMERTRATGVTPWPPGERSHWYRLIPQAISGRRIAADRRSAKRR